MESKLAVIPPTLQSGPEKCIFCGETHQTKEQKPLDPVVYERNDDLLTNSGRTFIKGDEDRFVYYPKDENDNWVSPLEEPKWNEGEIFNTYQTKEGGIVNRAEKYQKPPIHGWIAAPHHILSICCLNGTNKLPGKPKVNPWAKKGGYDINAGGNCIFLPSSASQFFVAYYLYAKRGTGKPLQGHFGAHRKEYFQTVWSMLERLVRLNRITGLCDKTESEADKDTVAKLTVDAMHVLEGSIFQKLAHRQPDPKYRLGAKTYITPPSDNEDIEAVRTKISGFLKNPYEILPNWY